MTHLPRETYYDVASDLCDRIVASVPREEILSVFLCGSGGRREIVALAQDGVAELFSDIDLYVVVREGNATTRNSIADAVERFPTKTDRYHMYHPPDVGVYTMQDLCAQPARPGTVGLDRHHMMLFGDDSLPRRAGRAIGTDIAPQEALYLLENRALEWCELLADGGAPALRYTTYLALKTGADLASAGLVAVGRFESSRESREAGFRELVARGRLRSYFSDEDITLVESCQSQLARFSHHVDEAALRLEALRKTVTEALTKVWERIGVDLLPVGAGDFLDVIDRRCHKGRYLANLREYFRVRSTLGLGRAGSLRHAVRAGEFSVVNALRGSGLLELRGTDTGDLHRFLDRVTRSCDFVAGPVYERARRMYGTLM